jgi:hypothetical protein
MRISYISFASYISCSSHYPLPDLSNYLPPAFADFLLGLLFCTDDGSSMFFQNVCWLLPDCTVFHPIWQYTSFLENVVKSNNNNNYWILIYLHANITAQGQLQSEHE